MDSRISDFLGFLELAFVVFCLVMHVADPVAFDAL